MNLPDEPTLGAHESFRGIREMTDIGFEKMILRITNKKLKQLRRKGAKIHKKFNISNTEELRRTIERELRLAAADLKLRIIKTVKEDEMPEDKLAKKARKNIKGAVNNFLGKPEEATTESDRPIYIN